MPTGLQFHQNKCCKTGQQKVSIIDKINILPTYMVNYKYTDQHATMKRLHKNKPLNRKEPLCRNELLDQIN